MKRLSINVRSFDIGLMILGESQYLQQDQGLNNVAFIVEQVLYWLSGLSCTDENFIAKSGAQRAASTEGIVLIAPDTSPSKDHKHLWN